MLIEVYERELLEDEFNFFEDKYGEKNNFELCEYCKNPHDIFSECEE